MADAVQEMQDEILNTPGRVRRLVVAYDEYVNECLYIDGNRWDREGEATVYATDLAGASEGKPVTIEHRAVDWDQDTPWPLTLEELMSQQPQANDAG